MIFHNGNSRSTQVSFVAQRESRKIIFSMLPRKNKRKSLSRVFISARERRCQTRSVLFSFSPSILPRPSNADNKRGPAWRARDFSMKGTTSVRKACYTRTAFVKVTQKSIQVIQVRQFQELGELVPLFLPRISRVLRRINSLVSRYFILRIDRFNISVCACSLPHLYQENSCTRTS